MRVRFIVPVLIFAFVVSAAVGRVGENESELVARYGAVTNRQPARKSVQGRMNIYGERLGFKFEFWTVSAVIIAGRCEEITYSVTGKWTDPHFRRLLEINGGWTDWAEHRTRNPDNHRLWLRRDKTSATWGLNGLMIRTPAMEKVLSDLDAAAKR